MPANSSRSAEFKVLILLFAALTIICTVINFFSLQWKAPVGNSYLISQTFHNIFVFINGIGFIVQLLVIIFCIGRLPKGALLCAIVGFVGFLVQIVMLLFSNEFRAGFWLIGWIFEGLFSLFTMLMAANYALVSAEERWWERS